MRKTNATPKSLADHRPKAMNAQAMNEANETSDLPTTNYERIVALSKRIAAIDSAYHGLESKLDKVLSPEMNEATLEQTSAPVTSALGETVSRLEDELDSLHYRILHLTQRIDI